jgi:hypothetical protein
MWLLYKMANDLLSRDEAGRARNSRKSTCGDVTLFPFFLIGISAFQAASNWREDGMLATRRSLHMGGLHLLALQWWIVIGPERDTQGGVVINGSLVRWRRLQSWVWQEAVPGLCRPGSPVR